MCRAETQMPCNCQPTSPWSEKDRLCSILLKYISVWRALAEYAPSTLRVKYPTEEFPCHPSRTPTGPNQRQLRRRHAWYLPNVIKRDSRTPGKKRKVKNMGKKASEGAKYSPANQGLQNGTPGFPNFHEAMIETWDQIWKGWIKFRYVSDIPWLPSVVLRPQIRPHIQVSWDKQRSDIQDPSKWPV